MALTVTNFKAKKAEKIIRTAHNEWDFDDLEHNEDEGRIFGCDDGNLCGGETEDQFAKRMAKAIFKANGAPCKVEVVMTCLEDLPCETYTFNEKHKP